MDLTPMLEGLVDAVRSADVVEPVGARTHAAVGGAVVAGAAALRAPSGIVRHDPDDMTVTAGAGTSFAELDAALGDHDQFVALDPRDPTATIGGTLAAGLSGVRRLGCGPVRDHLLEARFVTGYGAVVKAGGPTVKNVTGFDLARLLVGSLGTLGLIGQVTLRCRPRPRVEQWWSTSTPAATVVADGFRPWSVLSDGSRTTVLLAGEPADVEWGVGRLADAALVEAPTLPSGPHRGRISVPPGRLDALVGALRDVEWCAEWGVGTVHVACADEATLAAARVVAHDHGGWLLREAGAPTLDPFGVDLPNAGLAARVRAALDPDGRMARGRFA